MPEGDLPAEPLKVRALSFLAAMAVGLAVAAVGGMLWGLATRLSVPQGIGYAIIILATIVLLVGGASGGGFAKQLGAPTTRVGRASGVSLRPEHDAGVADPLGSTGIGGQEGLHPREPDIAFLRKRLADELRPRRNPDAFWTVIGGATMMAIGVLLLQIA